ncbi:MAG: RidA family protein [Thermoanaerobaculia bacterium]
MSPARTDAASLLPVEPVGWARPRGYSNGMLAPAGGRLLFVAGQIGWDSQQRLVEGGFAEQFRQALSNVVTVVETAGGHSSDLGRLTIYVSDRSEYLDELGSVGEAYLEIMGRHFPAMALVVVRSLLEPGAKVEIEGTAVIAEASERIGEGKSDGD